MGVKIKILLAILLILTLTATSNFKPQIEKANCLPANSMWTEPQNLHFNTTTTPIGYKFNITIYANLSVSSYAWQFYLTYNKNHLQATGCWYSKGAKSEWAGTRPTSPQLPSYGSHNTTHNYVFFGESLQGIVETPPGKYSLAIVEFQIIAQPPQGQTYTSQIRLDISGAFSSTILDPDLNDIPLNYGGTTYKYEGPAAPPPPPPPPPPVGAILFVDPPEIIDPTLIPPKTFQINVTVNNVQNLYGYEFNMSFNKDVLTCLLIMIHDVQGETNYIPEMQINNLKGFLWVRVTYYSPANPITTTTPLALATITFRVRSMGASILDLHDTQLVDNQGNPIEHETRDGFVMTLIRDIAVTNVTPSRDWAYAGWPITVSVTVKNLGYITESFNVSSYYDNNLIGTIEVLNLTQGAEETVIFIWDTTGLTQGTYTLSAKVQVLPYEIDTANNVYINGQVNILTEIRDIAVTNVSTPYNWAYHGWIINITVTVKNLGTQSESFNVTTYYNQTEIGTIAVTSLPPGGETSLTFNWNTTETTPCHTYIIWAEATQIPYEYNVTNNIYIDGTAKIRIVGDVNGDGIVDIKDVAAASKAFGSQPGMPQWNDAADINRDRKIDIKDVALVSRRFGSTC